MGKSLKIRNPRPHELALELAERRNTTITEAVITVLENELLRERTGVALFERLDEIAKQGPDARLISKEDGDEIWSR